MANSNIFFKAARGKLGLSRRMYSFSRQICIVSSSGTLVKSNVISKEHIKTIIVSVLFSPISKLKRVFYCVLVGGDWTQYVNKERV